MSSYCCNRVGIEQDEVVVVGWGVEGGGKGMVVIERHHICHKDVSKMVICQ